MTQAIHATQIQLVPIGNSQGIRLAKPILEKYGFARELILEEKPEGILIRPKKKKDKKFSWKETFRAMASEKENWDDFDATLLDGLEENSLMA